MCVCVCACMRVRACMRVCVWMHVHVCVCSACMHACMLENEIARVWLCASRFSVMCTFWQHDFSVCFLLIMNVFTCVPSYSLMLHRSAWHCFISLCKRSVCFNLAAAEISKGIIILDLNYIHAANPVMVSGLIWQAWSATVTSLTVVIQTIKLVILQPYFSFWSFQEGHI